MDSLKSLLDQKNYELVLKLTEGSEAPNDLFYRISAYIYLGKYEDALYVIQDHQKILEGNLVSLINAHINLLCVLGRFEQAHTVLDYYNNLPYQSQAVEEVLRKMPEVIELEEKKQTTLKFYDDEQVEKYLLSEKDEDVLIGLDTVRNRDVFRFLPVIQKVMVSHPRQMIRSYSLMLLVQKEVDRELKMNSNGEIIDVNPKHLNPPFTSVVFNDTIRLIDSEYKDPTLAQSATQLFSEYEMYLYPRSLKDLAKNYAAAFYIIARKYANSPLPDIKQYCDAMELDENHIVELVKDIEKILSDV
jgi:hypothetical protein